MGEALKLTYHPDVPPPPFPSRMAKDSCLGLGDVRICASQYCKDGRVNVEVSKSGMWHDDGPVNVTPRLGRTGSLWFSSVSLAVSLTCLSLSRLFLLILLQTDPLAVGRHWSLWRHWLGFQVFVS